MIRTLSAQLGVNVSGVGYQLKDASGGNVGSRVTSGISNIATGCYRKASVDTAVAVAAYWDSGDGTIFASEVFDTEQDQIWAASFGSVAVSGDTLTLSTGATQVITESGRVTTP